MSITVGTKGGIQSNSITVSTLSTTKKLVALLGNHQGSGAFSACTLNGVALTFDKSATTAFNERSEIWHIDNPGALTNVTLTFNPNGGSGPTIGYINLEGTNTGTDNTATNNGESSGASVTILPTKDNCIVIASGYSEANATSFGGGATSIYNVTGQSFENGFGSYILQTSATSQNMSFGLAFSARWADCAISVSPFIPPVISGENSSMGLNSLGDLNMLGL